MAETATTQRSAVDEPLRRGTAAREVRAAGGTSGSTAANWQETWEKLRGPRRVPAVMMATALSQMADLLVSGVPLLRTLELLGRQSGHPTLTATLQDVRQQVAEGQALDVAMARHPLVFNELTVSMVRAGSEGGFLEDVLQRTAGFIEQQEDLKGRVVGAATYPVILAIAGFSAVTVLVVFFVPKFAELFERLKERGELPAVTTGLLATSDFLGRYGLWLLAGAVAAGWWAYRALRTPEGKRRLDGWKLKLPIVGPVYQSLAVSRFCRVLGTLLKNGVPILRSLEIASGSVGNVILAEAIRAASENISAGQSLAQPLGASKLFPPTVVEMIGVAEEANNLEEVLVKVADGIDRRTQRQLDLAVRLMEPAMLVVMAGVVLLIVAALLLPVFKMSSAMS